MSRIAEDRMLENAQYALLSLRDAIKALRKIRKLKREGE
jgi:hypothetical protein